MATVASPSSNKQIVEQIIDFENNGRKVGLFFDLTKKVSIPNSASPNQIDASIKESSVYKQILEAFRGKKQKPIFYIKIRDPSNLKQFTVVVKKGEDTPFSQKYESSKEFARKVVSTPPSSSSPTPNIVDMPKYWIVDNAGGGNCFFEAIFYSLYYQGRDVKQFLNTIYQYIAIWGDPAVINGVATSATYGTAVPYLENLTTFSAEVDNQIKIASPRNKIENKNLKGKQGPAADAFNTLLRNLIRLAILSSNEQGCLPRIHNYVNELFILMESSNAAVFSALLSEQGNLNKTKYTNWANFKSKKLNTLLTAADPDLLKLKRLIANSVIVDGSWVGQAVVEIMRIFGSESFQNVSLTWVGYKDQRNQIEKITKKGCQDILLWYESDYHYKTVICKNETFEQLLVNQDLLFYILQPEQQAFYGTYVGSTRTVPSKNVPQVTNALAIYGTTGIIQDTFLQSIPASLMDQNGLVGEIEKMIKGISKSGFLEKTKDNQQIIANYQQILKIIRSVSGPNANQDLINQFVPIKIRIYNMKIQCDYNKYLTIFLLNILLENLNLATEFLLP